MTCNPSILWTSLVSCESCCGRSFIGHAAGSEAQDIGVQPDALDHIEFNLLKVVSVSKARCSNGVCSTTILFMLEHATCFGMQITCLRKQCLHVRMSMCSQDSSHDMRCSRA